MYLVFKNNLTFTAEMKKGSQNQIVKELVNYRNSITMNFVEAWSSPCNLQINLHITSESDLEPNVLDLIILNSNSWGQGMCFPEHVHFSHVENPVKPMEKCMKSQVTCAAACSPNAGHLSKFRGMYSHPVSDQATDCKSFLLNDYFLFVMQCMNAVAIRS